MLHNARIAQRPQTLELAAPNAAAGRRKIPVHSTLGDLEVQRDQLTRFIPAGMSVRPQNGRPIQIQKNLRLISLEKLPQGKAGVHPGQRQASRHPAEGEQAVRRAELRNQRMAFAQKLNCLR